MWQEEMFDSDFKSVDYNEFDDYFELVADNVLDAANQIDITSILENNNEIDLFEIEAINLLNKIKKMISCRINKELIKEKMDEIDADFKKSLREVLIVNNKVITDDYLKRLSYVYYAVYNNTLSIYYKLDSTMRYIDYFMLEEKFYNSINNVITFDKYRDNTNSQFFHAYKNNVEDEFAAILSINPKFVIKPFNTTAENWLVYDFFDKGEFKKIYDVIGPKVFANINTSSNIYILRQILFNLEYVKELISINQDIIFDEIKILSNKESLVTVFEMPQIAFFNKENKEVIEEICNRGEPFDIETKMLGYYKELIDLNSDFKMIDIRKEVSGIYYCLTKNINFPPSIYVKLTDEERGEWITLIEKIISSKLSFTYIYKAHSLINKLIKQYQEPVQKRLTK